MVQKLLIFTIFIAIIFISSCRIFKKPFVNSWYSYEIYPNLYSDIISEEIKDSVEVILYISGAYCGTRAAASNTRVKTSSNDTIQIFSMCKDTECKVGSKYLIDYSTRNRKLPSFGVLITNDSPSINRNWKIMFGRLISNDSL
jgi:hypothetical protein